MPATYPISIKTFITYEDQHGPITGPSDPSIIYAYITNEIHDEVIAVEKVMGLHPFTSPGETTLGGTLKDIFQTKAPRVHTHSHNFMLNRGADDHPQYVRTDGTRGFSPNPVGGVPGWYGNQLITLGQMTQMQNNGQMMTTPGLEWLVGVMESQFGYTCPGPWTITGGQSYGYTDQNGYLNVNFGGAFRSGILSFVYMRLPMPGGSHYGYTYRFVEDQLLLRNLTRFGATIQFAEDVSVDRSAWVALSWIAIGT
jgi:hypothetical protein